MIIVAFGSNMPGACGPPAMVLDRARRRLDRYGVRIVRCSAWYRSRASGRHQADFVNGVAVVETGLAPRALLLLLGSLERRFGRRPVPGGPRVLDLDLIDYHNRIIGYGRWGRWETPRLPLRALSLPHPEMQRRIYVLQPLLDIAPEWRHPLSGLSARDLLAVLPIHRQRQIEPLPGRSRCCFPKGATLPGAANRAAGSENFLL